MALTLSDWHIHFRKLAPTAVVVVMALSGALPALAKFDHSHQLFTSGLRRYVTDAQVHYAQWQKDQGALDSYLKQLAAISPAEYAHFTDGQKKALWINAYNALTIKVVLDHYPINGTKPYYPTNSLRQIPDVWEQFHFKVAGKDVDLYTIEHEMIRKQFQDPRMHFAVVCASNGCPPILNRAYVGETIEKDLDDAARRYFSLSKNVQYDPDKKVVRVSRLFRWFPLDFAVAAGYTKMPFPPPSDDSIVLSYALSMAPPEIRGKFSEKDTQVNYLLFDWSLNDADAGQAKPAPDKSNPKQI